MSDVKRYWVYEADGRSDLVPSQPSGSDYVEVVLAHDYATLEAECRWAMELIIRVAVEKGIYNKDYQRAVDWLDAHHTKENDNANR